MALPLYLAMTTQEMDARDTLPPQLGWMACHFDPAGSGLRDIPDALPPGAMLILNDRFPCRGHDPQKVSRQLTDAVKRLNCEGVLLDFQRKPDAHFKTVADALFKALPCPVAAPPGFIKDLACAVFLPPCPLHVPLAEYLLPRRGQAIWLDVTMGQQTITVTRNGTTYAPPTPADMQDGRFDDILLCRYVMEISEEEVRFTLFDTPETLKIKLQEAAKLGVTRAVGLYQELGGKL